MTAVAKLGMVETGTKTHQARAVALSEFVMDLLAEHIKGRSPEELAFPYHDGTWTPRDWFALRLEKAASVAQLSGVTPHVLRHTAGSLALASGASVVTVQKLLGHLSPITTMNVYAAPAPRRLRQPGCSNGCGFTQSSHRRLAWLDLFLIAYNTRHFTHRVLPALKPLLYC